MRISRFFIDRPIFACVLALVVAIVGAIAYVALPVSQYPNIVPPTVTVTATYPGANAQTVAETVAAPIEQAINGVDDMLYQSSQSTGDGKLTITVTFKVGTDPDKAQVLVQNRVSTALPRLPDVVQRLGIETKKISPAILMAVNINSDDGSRDLAYIQNYARTQVVDPLSRIDGIGNVDLMGGGQDYSIRVWIDPNRAAALDLTASEIVDALRSQNVQVAAGKLGQAPTGPNEAFQVNLRTLGRLTTPEQFADIVIRTDAEGRQVKVKDVARVELGSDNYSAYTYLNGKPTAILNILARPGSDAVKARAAVYARMKELSKGFPAGINYSIAYDPTRFVVDSINAGFQTLLEATVLVILVILVFLQKWRAAIIPVIAIPVSVLGTCAVLLALGYSINNLSLFGIVLAIGIVVDDAIVVVENVERNLESGMSALQAARKSMDEVGTALVAIVLVLCAVFVPTLFITGLSGEFYKQFAVTIATATIFSLILSLTLSPAMAALMLKASHHDEEATGIRGALQRAAVWFNTGFERMSERYAALTHRLVLMPKRMMSIYAGLIALTIGVFWYTPVGFVPLQDQGYFAALVQLPPGASLQRTDAIVKEVAKRTLKIEGVAHSEMFVGMDGLSSTLAPNSGVAFFPLKSFDERDAHHRTMEAIMADTRKALADINDARILVVPPPVIQGIGGNAATGYRIMLQDRGGHGYQDMGKVAQDFIAKANATKGLSSVFTFYDTSSPSVYADIDRTKADMLGVPPGRVFDALQTYMGSTFINDFNLLGRTYHVTAQADAPYRRTLSDVANLRARSNQGGMVPIGSLATFKDESEPYRVTRYNLFPAVEIDGETAPGYSSGHSLKAVEALAAKALPQGYGSEWTSIAYQQTTVGNTAGIVFVLAIVFVFLVLAAQFESLSLPLSIVLILPMCLLAAMTGVNLRGYDNNVLTQIGLIVLIALAAKNAILVVEFARQAEHEGLSPVEAAVKAAQMRLRPILMTSFAFILGAVPLALAHGAGAELRTALGTAVCFGMLGVTGFGLLFTPTFYVVCRTLGLKWAGRRGGATGAIVPAE
ncbi:efflux RND transporter permease subunit [Sphingomonas sp. PR090111-T3T-6A]|uniref:efflux RND transporter permease subunit n=1 Tax=Sphingomonas sp. PR090111-T3T-6A TaxID=685778 RepID=UPI0003740A06|nr:multidrug efflux RND transporter permease subunit [Sphingomonas sp. PR090111-T3T-6A]